MAALHIIGVNFQLRSGAHLGLRTAQVFVRLVSRRFLSILTHHDAAGENTSSFPIKNVFIQLIAGTIGKGVVHHDVVVDKLARFSQHDAR
ncbi:MAG: hypothetical protein BWY72_02229 [Bacteroidetes bacterium ADurb.Bin416]|nr:MAG: hypothetical protein BWY72_02229 [Bacteroidetes bacterium ADurb.Bin416]